MTSSPSPRTQRREGVSVAVADFCARSLETIASLGLVSPPREIERIPVFLQDRLALVLVDAVDRRELVLPGPRPHRIDRRARLAEGPVRGLLRGHPWVQ